MKNPIWYRVHNKYLPVPSFFMIYNIGGGGGDRTRSVVYMDLYNKIPQLYNYYYLNLMAKMTFDTSILKHLPEYDDFADFIKYMRETLIYQDGKYSKKHIFKNVDYKETVYLLDSGAKNILDDIVEGNIARKKDQSIIDRFVEEMRNYYIFANKHKFDLVISFDTGGKYTFKDNEKSNPDLIEFDNYLSKNKQSINIFLLEEAIKYLKADPNYYPYVLATVHGNTPEEYASYTEEILKLEKKYNYKFWGFALGGIASSKGMPDEWFKGYSKKLGISKNTYLSSVASKIVHSIVGDRPIHPLGAGGYDSIDSLYKNGATSFDSNTPNRRAGDGNGHIEVASQVMNTFAGGSFSKYLIGKKDKDLKDINPELEQAYLEINKVLSTIKLCGCPACSEIYSIDDIKRLYSEGENNKEDFFLSKQLMCAHSTWQHIYSCMKYWYDWED